MAKGWGASFRARGGILGNRTNSLVFRYSRRARSDASHPRGAGFFGGSTHLRPARRWAGSANPLLPVIMHVVTLRPWCWN
jgi:hypothetical protein